MLEYLMQLIYNPFSFHIDFDRYRRSNYTYYGRYQPTKLKQFMIWIFNEKIEPVNWEEVPPYVEPNDDQGALITCRDGDVHPYECLTQPDMLTKKDIFVRRLILAGVFCMIYRHFDKNQFKYISLPFIGPIYQNVAFKIFLFSWFYYMACRIYVHRDYQLSYN